MLVQRYCARELTLMACLLVAGCANLDPDAPPTPTAADEPGHLGGDPRIAASPDEAIGPGPRARVPRSRAPVGGGVTPPAPPRHVADWPSEPAKPAGPWARLRADFRLPAVDNERVRAEIERYAGAQHYFNVVAGRAEPYLPYILDRIEARDLPAELLMVPIVESAFRPFAYSRSHAGGLWQFKSLTARRFGLEQNWWYDGRRDVLASTDAALDYLEYLHEFFNGDWLLAMAAYNAGEGRVRRAIRANEARGRPTDYWHLDLPTQTEKYVPRILALRTILAAPDEYGIELPSLSEGAAVEVVELEGQVDLSLAAEMAGMPLEELYHYNAGLNRWVTPPGGPHRLALPASRADDFRTALAQREAEALVQWRRHAISSGETLSEIARAYNTSVTALRDLNDIEGHLIRAGQHLLVPAGAGSVNAAAQRGYGTSQRLMYRVRRGDTLWEIARAHGVAVDELARWNGITPDDTLHPGQRLAIRGDVGRGGQGGGPAAGQQQVEYTVRKGDSLYVIAQRFNVRVADLRRWNGIEQGSYLQPGQRLQIRVDVTSQTET